MRFLLSTMVVLKIVFLTSCGQETSTGVETATVRAPIIPGSAIRKSKKVLKIELYNKISQKVHHAMALFDISREKALDFLVKNKLITRKEKKFFSSQDHKSMEDKVQWHYFRTDKNPIYKYRQ